MRAVRSVQTTERGRNISVSPTPKWITEWRHRVYSNQDLDANDPGELLRVLSRDTLKARKRLKDLLDDPTVVRGLIKEHQRLTKEISDGEAKNRVLAIVAVACVAHEAASSKKYASRSEQRHEMQALARSCKKVAKNIEAISTPFGAADALPYLEQRIAQGHDDADFVLRRLGNDFRAFSYVAGKRPRLYKLLMAYACDLEDELKTRSRQSSTKQKQAGKLARRNEQIDQLILQSQATLGRVPFALITHIVSAVNNSDVDESVVRKRAKLAKNSLNELLRFPADDLSPPEAVTDSPIDRANAPKRPL